MEKLTAKKLKVGLLIWWVGERSLNKWNCPGIVTKLNGNKNVFRVRTFDDFKETADLLIVQPLEGKKSSLEEMRLANPSEVVRYLTWRMSEAAKDIADLEKMLIKHKKETDKYKAKAEELITSLRPTTATAE